MHTYMYNNILKALNKKNWCRKASATIAGNIFSDFRKEFTQ